MYSPPTLLVPPPMITITGFPLDEGFHTGLMLTFTTRAEFNLAVNSSLNVDALWSKSAPSSDLKADERVSIGEAVMVGVNPMVFESNLTIFPLRMSDVGTYTVSLTISSTQPFTVGTTASGQRTISQVLGKSCDI